MKRKRKLLKKILLVAVVILIAAAMTFYFTGEYLIKTAVETAAVKALSVGVYIDDLDLSILKGNLTITGLTVRNPAGYKTKNLLQLRKCSVKSKLASLLSDTVIINQLNLDGLDLTLEQKGLTNNLQEVLDSLERPRKPDEESKKLKIEHLRITGLSVNAHLLPLPGKTKTVSFTIPDITMNNLGGGGKLDTFKLTRTIFVTLAAKVAQKGADILPRQAVGAIRSTLRETFNITTAATETGRKVLEKGTNLGKGVIKGIEGIFKTNEQNEPAKK